VWKVLWGWRRKGPVGRGDRPIFNRSVASLDDLNDPMVCLLQVLAN
jgi:hypothetical protein